MSFLKSIKEQSKKHEFPFDHWEYKNALTNEAIEVLKDLDSREKLILIPLGLLIIFFGLYPSPVLDLISSSSDNLINTMDINLSKELSGGLSN